MHTDTKVTLDQEAFIFGLACSPHLSFNYPLGKLYKILQDRWFYDWFWFLFEVCGHIACCKIMLIKFGEINRHQYPSHRNWKGDQLASQPLGWTLAIQFRDTLWSILIFISLVWQHGWSAKWWFTRFALCWICIEIGWYYKWTFVMPSISHHKQPFFKSYGLLLVPWISFSICLMIFYMPIPLY